MKKLICLIVVLANIFSITVSADVIRLTEEAKNDLYTYGIMTGDQNGDLRLEDNITRAEFCKMICVTLGFKDIQLSVIEDFYDVDTKHWAYHYIQMAKGLALIEDIGNGYFNPDENITVQDIVKIIVTALGYKPKAEKEAYPAGYINVAEEIGLIKKNEFDMEKYATREETACLISACLDIPLLQQTSFGQEQNYTIMNGINNVPLITLRKNITNTNIESDNKKEAENTVPHFNGPEYTGRIVKISSLKKVGKNYHFNNSLDTKDTATYIITEETFVYLSVNTLDLTNIKNDMYMQCWHYTEDSDNIELLKIELMKEKPSGI